MASRRSDAGHLRPGRRRAGADPDQPGAGAVLARRPGRSSSLGDAADKAGPDLVASEPVLKDLGSSPRGPCRSPEPLEAAHDFREDHDGYRTCCCFFFNRRGRDQRLRQLRPLRPRAAAGQQLRRLQSPGRLRDHLRRAARGQRATQGAEQGRELARDLQAICSRRRRELEAQAPQTDSPRRRRPTPAATASFEGGAAATDTDTSAADTRALLDFLVGEEESAHEARASVDAGGEPDDGRRDHRADRDPRRLPRLQRQQRPAVRPDLPRLGPRSRTPNELLPGNEVRIGGVRVGVVQRSRPSSRRTAR